MNPPAITQLFITAGLLAEGRFLIYRILLLSILLTALYFIYLKLKNKNLLPWIVLAAAAALDLLLLSRPSFSMIDSRGFWLLSREVIDDPRLILFRPKLYPWFLSLFPGPFGVALFQCQLRMAMVFMFIYFGTLRKWNPVITSAARLNEAMLHS